MVRAELSDYTSRQETDQSRTTKLKETNAQLLAELSELNASLSDHKRKLDSASRAQRNAEDAREELREEIADLERSKRRLEAKNAELEDANSDLVSKLSELKIRESNSGIRCAVLEENKEELEATLAKVEEELLQARLQLQGVPPGASPAKVAVAVERAEQLSENVADLDQQLKQTAADRDRLQLELADVKDTLANLRAEYRQLQHDAADSSIHDNLKALQERLQTAKTENAELRDQVVAMQEAKKAADEAFKQKFEEEQGNNLDLVVEVQNMETQLKSVQASYAIALVSTKRRNEFWRKKKKKKKKKGEGVKDSLFACLILGYSPASFFLSILNNRKTWRSARTSASGWKSCARA